MHMPPPTGHPFDKGAATMPLFLLSRACAASSGAVLEERMGPLIVLALKALWPFDQPLGCPVQGCFLFVVRETVSRGFPRGPAGQSG